MQIDTSKWSGEGEFTQTLIDSMGTLSRVAFLRVEDAEATRSDVDYNFISNEVYVAFETAERTERERKFGFLPVSRRVTEKTMTLVELEAALSRLEAVGPPDYSDAGMIQYLRAERIIPPYQTRGYKLVELVRIYELK